MAQLTRALIVDDNEDHSEMLAMLLRTKGYEAETASSATEALGKCNAEKKYDLVVSDIGMPGINGYELARQIRGLPEYDQVVMIALTGFSIYGDRERALNAGFDDHLTKPVSPHSLIASIERLRRQKAP